MSEHAPSARAIRIRAFETGDVEWIARANGDAYARELGWGTELAAAIALSVAAFAESYDPVREHGWVAERDGRRVGSVLLQRSSDTEAQLRLLYVELSARELGVGARLVRECVRFAREAGYRTLSLWTERSLEAARRLYAREGFRFARSEQQQSFGRTLDAELWERALDDAHEATR